jgi:4-hydroxybenzoate polyprenyltransferase
METVPMSHTDIKENRLLGKLPAPIQPYALLMRLDRPVGIWLLVFPAFWSIILAAGGIGRLDLHILGIIALFAAGAVLMRGAGCIVNDLWDMKFDRDVARTKARPLAAGTVKPWQAFVMLAVLLSLSLLVLLQFSLVTILLGIIVLPLIAVYPLMKRWTWWPQAFLGLTFNFGALMGWSAVNEVIGLPALFLYAAGFFWTLGYDTIYAHQDKEDDAVLGLRSTALLLGTKSKTWVLRFYAAAATMLVLAGFSVSAGWAYFVILAIAAIMLYSQAKHWNPDDHDSSLHRFRAARDVGFLVLLAALLG